MASKLTKAQREARRKVRNEKILFGIRGELNSLVKIPRYKLTREHVNKVFRAEIEYVVDEGGGVVYPDRYMFECMTPPFKYFVVEKEIVELPPDDGQDISYIGQTQVVIWNVPQVVTSFDLEVWIKRGLERTDVAYSALVQAVDDVNAKLKQNQDRLDNVPYMQTLSLTDQGQNDERRLMINKLTKVRKDLEAELATATTALERESKRRAKTKLKLELVDTDEKRKLSTWHVWFNHQNEAQRAVDFDDWPLLKLALGYKTKQGLVAPQATFDELDDDRVEDEVVMRGVVIQRIRHGQGAYTDWDFGDAYRGEYYHGVRQGKGVLLERQGLYSGEFDQDQRKGQGTQVLADGSRYEGEFGCSLRHAAVPYLRGSEYRLGVPHGSGGVYTFPDGATYRGEFLDGEITGRGVYENPKTGERMEGEFKRGLLHGQGLHITPQGDRMEGTFRDGMLHGHGVHESKPRKSTTRFRDRSRCSGRFTNGKPDGQCTFEYRKGHTYEGFFTDGVRSGCGSMLYGNVKERTDRDTGKTFLEHEFEYQGEWLADRIRCRGCHITVHDTMSAYEKDTLKGKCKGYKMERRDKFDFTTNFKSAAKYPFLHRMVFKEEGKRRRQFARRANFDEAQRRQVFKLGRSNVARFRSTRRWAIQLYKQLDRTLLEYRDVDLEGVDAAGAGRASSGEGFGAESSGDGSHDSRVEEEEEVVEDEEDFWIEDGEDSADGASAYGSDPGYCDSDWESEPGRRHTTESASAVATFMRRNPHLQYLQLSLIDVYENQPPRDKMTGRTDLVKALEYFGPAAHAARLKHIQEIANHGLETNEED